jgi:hypothetical protein
MMNCSLFEGSQASLICPSDKNSVNMKMSVKEWWNCTDRGKADYREEKLIQGQFLGYMCHVE